MKFKKKLESVLTCFLKTLWFYFYFLKYAQKGYEIYLLFLMLLLLFFLLSFSNFSYLLIFTSYSKLSLSISLPLFLSLSLLLSLTLIFYYFPTFYFLFLEFLFAYDMATDGADKRGYQFTPQARIALHHYHHIVFSVIFINTLLSASNWFGIIDIYLRHLFISNLYVLWHSSSVRYSEEQSHESKRRNSLSSFDFNFLLKLIQHGRKRFIALIVSWPYLPYWLSWCNNRFVIFTII